jgi:hypothetical protein
MAGSSEDGWFEPFKFLSQVDEMMEINNVLAEPTSTVIDNIYDALKLKDELITELNNTIKVLKGDIEEKDLYITTLINSQNYTSINSTINSTILSTTSEEESSNCEKDWNVKDSIGMLNDHNKESNYSGLNSYSINDTINDKNHQHGNETAVDNGKEASVDIISELMDLNNYKGDDTIYSEISSGSDSCLDSNSYEQQISDYRYTNHWNYIEQKRKDTDNAWNVDILNKVKYDGIKAAINRIKSKIPAEDNIYKWPKNTTLIASDSMLNQLDEKRLSKNGKNVKVRCFSGSTIADMYYYLYPLLRKHPEYLVLHVGTNDCVTHTSDRVLDDLLQLKRHIELKVPGIKVILSQPIMRYDNDAIACLRVSQLINKLDYINIPLLENQNIVRKHIGKKGLHLNGYGTAKCAMNIISLIKGL